jgi:formate hydrogenlyase subunit 6/NADH:ubiquinone oxidoreductase subunit I
VDAGACIFCTACARACPTSAIRAGARIELATDERDRLVIVRSRPERE